jgi:hypothetical protein
MDGGGATAACDLASVVAAHTHRTPSCWPSWGQQALIKPHHRGCRHRASCLWGSCARGCCFPLLGSSSLRNHWNPNLQNPQTLTPPQKPKSIKSSTSTTTHDRLRPPPLPTSWCRLLHPPEKERERRERERERCAGKATNVWGIWMRRRTTGSCAWVDKELVAVVKSTGHNRIGIWEPTLSTDQYKATPCTTAKSSSNQHQQLDVGFYSPEARTSINSLCSLCSVCSCTSFEFLAVDSTSLKN